MFNIPELLAPAGGFEQLRAAVENGADAVYLGGRILNARMNANNFDDEEIVKAIGYAHLRGVKIYVALNTLITDYELKEALYYAAFLYENGVDALILQDLGFAELVKNNIPNMPIHLSTQGTVYNLEGVGTAKALGFSRVVLARELSLEEVKAITDENLIEIEVFVTGALCFCYSGQCQMSRDIGGRSGNRGVCAQPCRLPYSIYKEEKGNKIEVKSPGYALSPKDLCTIEFLDKLSKADIASLKIEGRMKSAEYVAITTSIYRKYLDLYAKTGEYKVEKKDMDALSQIFNRGGFTEGYLFNNPKKNLMSGNLPKHQGIYLGKVIESSQLKKTGNRQRGFLTIKLDTLLTIGDGIEVRNQELSGNIITSMRKNDQKVNEAKPGDTVTIGYIDGIIKTGDLVYKISDKNIMIKAKESFHGESSIAEKNLRKVDVFFSFNAGLNIPVSLSANDEDGNFVIKALENKVEKALTKSLTKDVVSSQLNKTGGTVFRIKKCLVEIEEGISIPLSCINELRRQVLEELDGKRKNALKRSVITSFEFPKSTIPESIESAGRKNTKKLDSDLEQFHLYLFNAKKIIHSNCPISRIYLPYEEVLQGSIDRLLDGFNRENMEVVPVIPNITKGWHDGNIRKNFNKIVESGSKCGISIGNIGWINAFVSSGIDVFGDFGLNLFNSVDFYVAQKMGIKEAVISHEAGIEEISKMDFHGVIPEVVIDGRIPLMISEHCIQGDLDNECNENNFYLKDRKGEFYPMLKNCGTCQSVIFSYKSSSNIIYKEKFRSKGINRFRIYEI